MESVEFLVNFFDLEKNRSHWSFVAGTLFLVRASILDVLTPEKLAAAYSMLTSDQTYDLRWLKYMARMKGATPQEVLRRAVVQNLPVRLSNFKKEAISQISPWNLVGKEYLLYLCISMG